MELAPEWKARRKTDQKGEARPSKTKISTVLEANSLRMEFGTLAMSEMRNVTGVVCSASAETL